MKKSPKSAREQGSLPRVVRRHWNWNPLRPVQCTGGIVRFGAYFECWVDGQMTLQTPIQFAIKCSMGLVPPNAALCHPANNAGGAHGKQPD